MNIKSHQCNICNINYDYITHLENSNEEASFLLRKMKIENLTRVAGKYSWSPAGKDEIRWSTIPRNTTIQIYKHYFIDFGKHINRSPAQSKSNYPIPDGPVSPGIKNHLSDFWILARNGRKIRGCLK